MANTSQEELFEVFLQVAGNQVSNLSEIVNTGEQLAGALGNVVKQINAAKPASGDTAAAVTKTAASETTSERGGSVLDTVGSIASSFAKNALGATPLVRGILSLFGGDDDSPEPQTFTKFQLPQSVAFMAVNTPGGFSAASFDQNGFQRPLDPSPNTTAADGIPTSTSTSTGQQITVNVQAMDARSFMDRSDDITAAVRSAMLNLNSINDVVSEL